MRPIVLYSVFPEPEQDYIRQTETGNVSEAHVVADIMTSSLFLRCCAYFEIKKCRSDFVVSAVDNIGIFYRNIFTE